MEQGKIATPLLDVLKANLQTFISLLTIFLAVAFYAFRVDNIDKALAAHEIQQNDSEIVQQEILRRLVAIETKQDRSADDIQELLKDVKELRNK